MTPESIQSLADLTTEQWQAYLPKWEKMSRVEFFEEIQEILFRAVCRWAGVRLEETEVQQRTKDIEAMIDGVGTIGLRHWRGRLGRKRAEKWVRELIEKIRFGQVEVAKGSAIQVIAQYRELNGEFLATRVAAVELLNVLRPTVAIAVYLTFVALALHKYPQYQQKLKVSDNNYREMFVQEVRRFYPFFPFVAARVRHNFDWNCYHFPKKTRVILDLYGTNHDEGLWDRPQDFEPERFSRWDGSAFNFIPQGGGDHYKGHRCPGEWVTIELMKIGLRFLTEFMQYDVPEQDLEFNLRRISALPKSRFLIKNVRQFW